MTSPKIDQVRTELIAQPGAAFDLSSRDSGDRSLFPDKKEARDSLKADAEAINELQDKLYANRDRALLVVLQGMDTAGKSGVIRNVFSDTSPLGLQ
ncbi:MAG: polyphosphate kinase 2 family protein, partial [Pseudomonadota bacterium]